MSNNLAVALFSASALSMSCGAGPTENLEVPPEAVCDVRLAQDSGWCGGDPTGTWSYASACHRGLLQWLDDLCPAGSFVMTPGRVTGALTLTSTSIRGTFGHLPEEPITVELFEGCIQTLGTCPRSYEGEPLAWQGDFRTSCVATLPFDVVGSDQGGIIVERNEITYELLPEVRNEFCVEAHYLYFSPLRDSDLPTSEHYYVLPRAKPLNVE